MTEPDSDFQREWGFIPNGSQHEDKIETISITVQPGISNENQTMLKYEYQYTPDLGHSTFYSTSGVIENEMNTWMHPHRDKYFMILELNPFPFIQQPFKVGNKPTACFCNGAVTSWYLKFYLRSTFGFVGQDAASKRHHCRNTNVVFDQLLK
jgi:hypothetical protein